MAKKKKSQAQIKRLMKRAEARGEIYVPPVDNDEQPLATTTDEKSNKDDAKADDLDLSKRDAAMQLTKEKIQSISENTVLKLKERRSSGKRKAEAIDFEEGRCYSATEIFERFEPVDATTDVEIDDDTKKDDNDDNNNHDTTKESKQRNEVDLLKRDAALQLIKELKSIAENTELKAKERRSAKRKAEAIAVEACGCTSATELLEWFEQYKKDNPNNCDDDNVIEKNKKKKKKINEKPTKHNNPYIVFVGQLSYETTNDDIFEHFEKNLSKENYKITKDNVKIRLLTDSKTNKSKGMAFIEIINDDPQILYACLKLHHTYLQGRRINVERSAGGNKNSTRRKEKLKQYKQEQINYIDDTISSILQEYYQRGEIQQGEIDHLAIELCKRHTPAIVQAALNQYVEKNGHDMDNPSAYFTYLLGKIAEEGIFEKNNNNENTNKNNSKRIMNNNKRSNNSNNNKEHSSSQKKQRRTQKSNFEDSEFAKQGIDMSVSNNKTSSSSSNNNNNTSSEIFPSLSRRGRGGRHVS